ncbi:MAG TPA: tetratricopeptide repeat protein [Chloroflexota bacterium]|nr:tetratricopeptide repeat protein [Chloroflexota bacterium]
MLETIRQFGLEQLAETGETDGARRRHARYYVRLAEETAPHLSGVRGRPWLARLAAEQDNLRVALDWCASAGDAGDAEGAALGLRLAAALWRFWSIRALAAEGRARLEGALAVAARYPAEGSDRPDRPSLRPALAEALHGAGAMARLQGDHDAARPVLERSAALWRDLGAERDLARALSTLGLARLVDGEPEGAAAALEESVAIFRRLGDGWGLAVALIGHAEMLTRRRGPPAAVAPLEEALALFRAQGEPWGQARALGGLGNVALGAGQLTLARERFEAALALSTPDDQDLLFADLAIILGEVLRFEGDYRNAEALYERSLELWRPVGHRRHVAIILHNLGYVALQGGHLRRAAGLFAEALRLHAETRRRTVPHLARGVAECLAGLAAVAARAGQAPRAARLFGAATALGLQLECQWDDADRRERERYTAIAREALGPPAFAAARAQGEGLTLEEAVAEALDVAALPNLDLPPSRTPAPRPVPAPEPPPSRQTDGLTPRERQVAALVAEGLTNRQVAARLVISESTAANHVEHILSKLGFHSRSQIAAWAVDRGLRPPSPG